MAKRGRKNDLITTAIIALCFAVTIVWMCALIHLAGTSTAAMVDNPLLNGLLGGALGIGAFYVQLCIHEAGHLVFGLLTGYRFGSFRIGSMMWTRRDGRLCCKKFSVPGTAGQCLMQAPEPKAGRTPFVLYNLGGVLLNIVTAVVFAGMFLWLRHVPVFAFALLCLSAIGWYSALVNGLPMHLRMGNNDGANVVAITQNPHRVRDFALQLKVADQLSQGIPVQDMPQEWFELPSPEEMNNSMAAARAVLVCKRLVAQGELQQADQLIAQLLDMEAAIAGVHRTLLICDRIFFELIGQKRPDALAKLLSPRQKKQMRTMQNFPTVLRTNYAIAWLVEKDAVKARKIQRTFEKVAEKYPYQADIAVERKLIASVEGPVSDSA